MSGESTYENTHLGFVPDYLPKESEPELTFG